jgi:hypothetical protein
MLQFNFSVKADTVGCLVPKGPISGAMRFIDEKPDC